MGGLGHDFKAGVNFINEPRLFITFNTGTGGPLYTHLDNTLTGPIQTVSLKAAPPKPYPIEAIRPVYQEIGDHRQADAELRTLRPGRLCDRQSESHYVIPRSGTRPVSSIPGGKRSKGGEEPRGRNTTRASRRLRQNGGKTSSAAATASTMTSANQLYHPVAAIDVGPRLGTIFSVPTLAHPQRHGTSSRRSPPAIASQNEAGATGRSSATSRRPRIHMPTHTSSNRLVASSMTRPSGHRLRAHRSRDLGWRPGGRSGCPEMFPRRCACRSRLTRRTSAPT